MCSSRVEARQQSSPRELHWSSGIPSQSLSRTLGGQSSCSVPGLKLVSSRHLVSSIPWSSGVPSQSLTLGGQSSCAVPGLKLFVSSHHLVSSIGRRASPHSHSHEHLGSQFVFSLGLKLVSSRHLMSSIGCWASPHSHSHEHLGSSCAVPGLKLVSSRHLVSSIGRRASPHSHSNEHLGSKFVFSPGVEARQQLSPRELHWSSGVPSQSLS